jgi:hypothetical protein
MEAQGSSSSVALHSLRRHENKNYEESRDTSYLWMLAKIIRSGTDIICPTRFVAANAQGRKIEYASSGDEKADECRRTKCQSVATA